MHTKDQKAAKETANKPSKASTEEEKMDEAIEDSFPASDPPPTSPMTTGAPRRGAKAASAPHGAKK